MAERSTLDGDGTLLVSCQVAAPVEEVWAGITESSRLERWFGTWTGAPSDGFVMVTMNAEAEPGNPTRYEIAECDRPRRLAVAAVDAMGSWRLAIQLANAGGGTGVTLRHFDPPAEMLGDMAAGWEWYLDRLTAAVEGTPLPDLAAFETEYAPQERHLKLPE